MIKILLYHLTHPCQYCPYQIHVHLADQCMNNGRHGPSATQFLKPNPTSIQHHFRRDFSILCDIVVFIRNMLHKHKISL
jgi:hypothetical protein